TMLARPEVALVEALAAVNAGDLPLAELQLASVEPEIDDHTSPRLRYLYATVRLIRARWALDMKSALAAYAMLDGADTGDADLDLLVRTHRGASAFWLDNRRSAKADLTRAHSLAVRARNDGVALFTHSHLGAIKIAEGDLASFARMADEAIDYAAVRGWSHSPRCAYPYGLAAWAAYNRADREAATRYATLAISVLDESVEPATELTARTAEAAVRFDHADQLAALQDWRATWARLGGYARHATQVAYGAPIELRMALAVGEVGWAVEVI